MYEHKTFEVLMSEMLGHINGTYPEMDTRTGSMIYTALAPIALELENAYHEMDMILDETFMGTASKEYLIKHGNQIGLEINDATYGHYIGEFNVDVPIGSRFNLDKYNYNVIGKLSEPTDENPYYRCELVCETSGSAPNTYLGDLTPITYVAELNHAKLISVISYGEDEEDTEVYRYRLQTHAKNPPIDGNIAQYTNWLNEYDGIGKYKIVPCWNGINTVKLIVLNSENGVAEPTFISQVQNHFDPPTDEINDDINCGNYPQGRGMGNGQAPIGAIVTVDTVTEIPTVVECTLKLKEGYSEPIGVAEAVEKYFKSTVLERTNMSYMAISAAIYNAESVEDVLSLTVKMKDQVMDINVTPFVSSVQIEADEVAVLDMQSSVWGV